MKSDSKSEILWAPWRMEYILGEKESGCIFCTRINQDSDKENLILLRGGNNFVIMNKYPYNNGHLMVVPNRHTSEFDSLSDPEKLEMMNLVSKSMNVLKKTVNPDGFNVGMNIGKIAGAGIDDHLHFHIVPRWAADTNFMPVVGQTKIISEDLGETWERLKEVFLT
ncbi:HIT domain-containing protein [candidate division KSB1 bacterium]|nr:HIT domain-containing protein [candidate division KSB1 bacterium]MCH7753804.1 HIT domain-containing protein [candidate division KSB1 bacterium]